VESGASANAGSAIKLDSAGGAGGAVATPASQPAKSPGVSTPINSPPGGGGDNADTACCGCFGGKKKTRGKK